jgi:hypothetical protein
MERLKKAIEAAKDEQGSTISRVVLKSKDMTIEVIADSAAGDYRLNFKSAEPFVVASAGDKWPDPKAERKAAKVADDIKKIIDKAQA